MKLLKILMILIGGTVFNGCSTKYAIIHIPLEIESPCVFEKFTEEEKQAITLEATGRKIYRNQQGCIIRHQKNSAIMQTHNELHIKE